MKFKKINYEKLRDVFDYTQAEADEFLEECVLRYIKDLIVRFNAAATKHEMLEAKMNYEKKDIEENLKESWQQEIENHHKKALINKHLQGKFLDILIQDEVSA